MNEDISRLSETIGKHETMCIFLGIGMIDKVVDEFLEGYEETTPVAVVKKATWPDQQIIRGTLADIAQKVKDANITKTAMEDLHARRLLEGLFPWQQQPQSWSLTL